MKTSRIPVKLLIKNIDELADKKRLLNSSILFIEWNPNCNKAVMGILAEEEDKIIGYDLFVKLKSNPQELTDFFDADNWESFSFAKDDVLTKKYGE